MHTTEVKQSALLNLIFPTKSAVNSMHNRKPTPQAVKLSWLENAYSHPLKAGAFEW